MHDSQTSLPTALEGAKELRIEYLPINTLKPNRSNPRRHSRKQISQIAQSIRTFGFVAPLLIDKERNVVCGHGRLAAAKQLGMSKVPVMVLENISATQAMALMLVDNKLAENSDWDEILLAQEIKILSESGINFEVELPGFEMGVIDCYIEGLQPADEQASDDLADSLAQNDAPPVSKPGDLWLLDRHRVLCGNALDDDCFRILLEGKKASMAFFDPPYNLSIRQFISGNGSTNHREFAMAAGEMNRNEFTDFLRQAFALAAKYTIKGSIHFIAMDWRHGLEIYTAGHEVYTELKNLCVWIKNSGGMGSFYRSRHELFFVFKSGDEAHRNNFLLGQHGRYRTNVWSYAGTNSFGRQSEEGDLHTLHPTVKPAALVADAIMDVSARGEVVLDLFLGSGTTVVAAERTGRICYGLELDPGYVDTIVRRWQRFTGGTAKHAVSGRTFNELEQEASR
jgi:DNA modification methylase